MASATIYVDSEDPTADVEQFIADYKIDDNFKPLARLLRRFAKGLAPLSALELSVPAAFIAGDATRAGDQITVVNNPADGGSPITHVEFKAAGGRWVTYESTATDVYTVPASALDKDISIRAVNAIGAGGALVLPAA